MNLIIKIVGSSRIIEEEVMSHLTNAIDGKHVWCFDPNADVEVSSQYYDIRDEFVSQKEWSVGYKLSHGTTVKELLKQDYEFYFEVDAINFFNNGEAFAAKVLDNINEIFEFEMNLA